MREKEGIPLNEAVSPFPSMFFFFLFIVSINFPLYLRHLKLLSANSFSQKFVALTFTCLQYKSSENCGDKEKLLVTSNFSFSHSVFYPFGELSAIFHQMRNCRSQTLSVWKHLIFFVKGPDRDYDLLHSHELSEILLYAYQQESLFGVLRRINSISVI